jgi:hypothetical protein
MKATPVIIPVTINYGDRDDDSDCAEDWVVDARIRITRGGNLVSPTELNGAFHQITLNGTPLPLASYPANITSAEFMLSSILMGPAQDLTPHLGKTDDVWTYTIVANPTMPATGTQERVYKVEIELVTYDPLVGCETILASDDFNVTYRPVTFTATDPFGCAEEEMCFSATVTYPPLVNIEQGETILNNMWIAGPFAPGMVVSVSGPGIGSFDWTIPGNVTLSGFYLSQIYENSVSAGTEYANDWAGLKYAPAGAWTIEICIDPVGLGATNFTLTPRAQVEIAQFNAQGVFQNY